MARRNGEIHIIVIIAPRIEAHKEGKLFSKNGIIKRKKIAMIEIITIEYTIVILVIAINNFFHRFS